VYNGNTWVLIASRGDVTDTSKYSTSKNPSTELYYRLHILNVVMSDLKKYKCSGASDGMFQIFYLQLILIGRCNYILAIFKQVVKQGCYACRL
jgi:hypothetical protein